jgi:hypothetical protein
MTLKKAFIIFLLASMTACGSRDISRNNNGDDGLDNGLIEYPPDSDGYVTSAFQGVNTYSSTTMLFICTVIAIRDGHHSNDLVPIAKNLFQNAISDEAKSSAAEASGLLFKDANNWYDINRDEIDLVRFYDEKCRVPIENMVTMYGNN